MWRGGPTACATWTGASCTAITGSAGSTMGRARRRQVEWASRHHVRILLLSVIGIALVVAFGHQ
jgi:hypothetical protein